MKEKVEWSSNQIKDVTKLEIKTEFCTTSQHITTLSDNNVIQSGNRLPNE